jgi:hypothetical protein
VAQPAPSFDLPEAGVPLDSDQQARKRALTEPGPSWREWLYFSAFRWWMGILFLIIDSWIVASFIEASDWVLLAPATLGAVYLEYLLYRYLWARPEEVRRGRARRRWPPFEVGRWTPEGVRARATGTPPVPSAPASDPREFL